VTTQEGVTFPSAGLGGIHFGTMEIGHQQFCPARACVADELRWGIGFGGLAW